MSLCDCPQGKGKGKGKKSVVKILDEDFKPLQTLDVFAGCGGGFCFLLQVPQAY